MKLYTCSHCKNLLYFENNVCLKCGHMVGFQPETLSMITLLDKAPGSGEPLADIRDKNKLYRWCANAAHGTCNWLIPNNAPSDFCVACQLNRTIPELSDPTNLSRWKRIEIAKHRLVYSLLRLHLPVSPKPAPETTAAAQDAPSPVSNASPSPAPAPAQPSTTPPAGLTAAQPSPSAALPSANRQPAVGLAAITTTAQPEAPEPIPGIAFDFMADTSPDERVMTGHADGVITLNIEEADEAERTRHKQELGEKYRTLLGHFRHEIGHYYWDVLIRDSSLLDGYRRLFGDEQKDYSEALQTYYANGAPADWMEHFISPYASAHPWEDWAETWAHYLHMMDTLETAYAFGIGIHPEKKNNITADISRDPYELTDFDAILGMWFPLTFAVNSLNRSMGHADFYPFVISPAIIEKLRFIHQAVGTAGAKGPSAAPASGS